MLLIKTSLQQSKLHGIGLFSDEPLMKGQKIWEFSPDFDLVITPEEAARMPAGVQTQLAHYAYTSKTSGNFILCSDDARFFNHDKYPNVTCVIPVDPAHQEALECYTVRDIAEGEEMTSDYQEYDNVPEPRTEP